MAAKIGKYSTNEFVDSTLIQPKRHQTGVPFVSVEESLNAIARANKIRLAVTGSLGGILAILFFGYAIIAGSIGFMSSNAGTLAWVNRPAFSGEAMQGGFITQEGQKIYGSLSTPAGSSFFEQVAVGFVGAKEAFIGKANLVNESAKIYINQDGSVSYDNKGSSETLEGKYKGNLKGEKQLVDQYILECVSGSCDSGELVIIDRANIYGTVG